MPKPKVIFECQKCGAQHPTWQGQCEECGKWNTLEEITFSNDNKNNVGGGSSGSKTSGALKPIKIADIDFKEQQRVKTKIDEFDRVLGGGFIKGQAVLIAGEPGIGKSTLLLQVADSIDLPVYYVCGEESPYQVKQRYSRLNLNKKNLELIENTDIETIVSTLSRRKKGLIITDSVNSTYSSKYKSSAGSISQIKETSQQLVNLAKKLDIPLILVGQINKDGDIAGPKTMEHLVDTVLVMEGDNNHVFRVVRSLKNRFGSINEVGLFTMGDEGLDPVDDPSSYLLQGKVENASGSAVCITNEGTRTFAIEVQALTNKTVFGYPKRTSNGFSLNRLNLLSAVINRRTKSNLIDQDIYLNIASGIKVNEPAADLAVCMAIISADQNKPLPKDSAFFGEIGLNGELRPVSMQESRIKESKNMGIKNLYNPTTHKTLNDVVKGVWGS